MVTDGTLLQYMEHDGHDQAILTSCFCVGKSLQQLTVVNKLFNFGMPVGHNPTLADISGGFVPIFHGFLKKEQNIDAPLFLHALHLCVSSHSVGGKGNVLEMKLNYKQLMTTGLWSCFLNWLGL